MKVSSNLSFGGKPPFMSPWENPCGFDSPDLTDQNMVVKGGIYRGDIYCPIR